VKNGPDAHDIAVAVIAVAKVLNHDPEALLRHHHRWFVIDVLHHGWPGCSLAWRSRALGYKDKVHRPKHASAETQERVREAWEALRVGARPSEIGSLHEAPRPLPEPPEPVLPVPVPVPLPEAGASKARLREFLARVVANTGGRPVDAE
jgi:hypothetical protein